MGTDGGLGIFVSTCRVAQFNRCSFPGLKVVVLLGVGGGREALAVGGVETREKSGFRLFRWRYCGHRAGPRSTSLPTWTFRQFNRCLFPGLNLVVLTWREREAMTL